MTARELLELNGEFRHSPPKPGPVMRRAVLPVAVVVLAAVLLLAAAAAAGALDPGDGSLGISLYNQGRLAEAREALERAAARGNAGAVELAVLGMTYTALGEKELAREVLLQAKEREPFSSLVHIGLGMLEFDLRNYDAAYQHFELAHRIEPESQQARNGMVASLVNRSTLLYGQGEVQQAEELLQEARRIQPAAPAVLQNLALIESKRGNLEQAAAYVREALGLEPNNPTLIALLIQIRRDQGGSAEQTEMIELYQRLVAAQPQNAQAHAELGAELEQRGRRQEAEKAFEAAESLDCEEPYPYLYLARISRQRGEDKQRLISRLHSAIGKAVRKSGMIRLQAAEAIRAQKGQLDQEQMEDLQRLSSLSEQPRRILLEALDLLAQAHGNNAEYEQDLQRLNSWYPHSLELQIALGRLLEEQRRPQQALALWRQILAVFPTATEAHLGLARSLEQIGEQDQAVIAYRRARDLAPQRPEVYAAFLRLCRSRAEEQELMQWYEELYARERTNVALLDAWAELEERLGFPEPAARHRLRARALEQRE